MIRVLIVEDQAILRESLARSVGDQSDMTVVAAIADASEALDVVLKERPDMILMDVCTEHDSNGIVAAARIKEELPECRVIIMTGMPEITFVDQAREAGVDSFVYKNVGIDELFGVMRSTLASVGSTCFWTSSTVLRVLRTVITSSTTSQMSAAPTST